MPDPTAPERAPQDDTIEGDERDFCIHSLTAASDCGGCDALGQIDEPVRTPETTTAPVDHQCEGEATCGCWCDLHDVPIAECPTFALVSSWLKAKDEEITQLRNELGQYRLDEQYEALATAGAFDEEDPF